jgi:hypothetical protein
MRVLETKQFIVCYLHDKNNGDEKVGVGNNDGYKCMLIAGM